MDLWHSTKLLSLISLPNEAWLEKWARLLRFREITPTICRICEQKNNVVLVDYGCGQDVLLKKYLDFCFPSLSTKITYIGVDPLVQKTTKTAKLTIIKSQFETVKLPQQADIVTMLAVLEHVDDATQLLDSAVKLLKPSGCIVGTTPSPFAKFPLEFLSYRLGIIEEREIREHKRYPTKESIQASISTLMKKKKKKISLAHHYFELGLNNFFEINSS